ncbi:hypothetical protein TNCV_4634461 [Trichonephila clavipes]|nr:hypothetical protein TNCV_4634461 [Trichonephila clavipes]
MLGGVSEHDTRIVDFRPWTPPLKISCLRYWFYANFEGEHLGVAPGLSHISSPSTNLTRGLAARRILRVLPCREDTIHLQTPMTSLGFEPWL